MAAMSAMMQQHWSKGAVAYAYSNEEGEAALTPLNEEVCSSVVSSVKPGSSLRILDTACGHGEPACTLASLLPQAEVHATDYAEGMVEVAKRRAASKGLQNMKLAVADVQDLSQFESNSFDVVTCVAALFVVPNYPRALREFKRVLKPGGLLVATVWGRMDENDLPRTLFAVRNVLAPPAEPPKKPEIDPELLKDRVALADIVKAADFSDVTIRDFNLVFSFQSFNQGFAPEDGTFMSHPFMTMSCAMIMATGVQNVRERVSEEFEKLCRQQGFVKDTGAVVFPKNVAIIATARA